MHLKMEEPVKSDALLFFCNGKKIVDENVDPGMTLLTYLRTKLLLTGTKLACGEGGCGACTVMVSRYHEETKEISHLAVNACLAPVCSVHGMAVTTVEGIGSTETKLHPVQERLAKAHGSQCGFCTPGIVMSMYSLLRNNIEPSMEEIMDAFQGNLCRCTGYRPIIEGYRSFSKGCCLQGEDCCQVRSKTCPSSESQKHCNQGDLSCQSAVGNTLINGSVKNCGEKANLVLQHGGDSSVLENGDRPLPSNKALGSDDKVINDTLPNDVNQEVYKSDHSSQSEADKTHHDVLSSSDLKLIDFDIENCKQDMNANKMVHSNDMASKMATDLFRSQDFTPYDATQEPIFPPELMLMSENSVKSVVFFSENIKWYRPVSLKELLELKATYPDAKIIVGNTEVGVEVKFRDCSYPVLIAATHIKELNRISVVEGGVLVGASATLTKLCKFLKDTITHLPESQTKFFQSIVEMLHWFAGTQIRNVAAIGGNIMTGSPISDLNPLLMAGECTLCIASLKGKRTVTMNPGFYPSNRKTVLEPTEILTGIVLPFSSETEHYFGIKQSPRREDDIAIINAGMKVRFREGSSVVDNIKIAYGGMAATTIMAEKTMMKLKGRAWDDNLLEEACHTLPQDLTLPFGVPGGMELYRQSLSLSFFFKFYLKVLERLHSTSPYLELSKIPATYQSALSTNQEASFQSTQLFEEVPSDQSEINPIGRPIIHRAALQQATGEAVYLDDIPKIESELFMAFVFSQKAHARIISVDFSAALQMKGVYDIVTHEDVPGSNKVNFIPEDLFAVNEVTCIGQIIAAVVAEDKDIAQQAAKLVQVEYEDLEVTITLEEAFEKKKFVEPTRHITVGDVDRAFDEADHILEGECRTGAQEHFYMETQAAIAIPSKEDGGMEIISSDQNLTDTQINVAGVLDIKRHKVVCHSKRLGGGFGGKETRAGIYASAVAVAAKKVKRPVRFMLDRDEDMRSSGTRSSVLGKYKVGCTKEGKILGLDLVMAFNAGNTVDLSTSVAMYSIMALDNVYKIPNVRATGYVCKTNIPSCTAMRGFGVPQSLFITETWLTDVANTCGISQKQVREVNFLHPPEDLSLMNQCWEDWNIPRCWEVCLKRSNYDVRRKLVDQFNRQNRWKKRGLAITPAKHGVGMHPKYLNQAGALVHIYSDGSVLVSHGGVEMGQGLHTKMIQVASQALGIRTEKIFISETSTDKVPNTIQTAGSIGSDVNGMAVKRACETLFKRLQKYMIAKPKDSWEDWVSAAYLDSVGLSAVGFHKPADELTLDFESRTGRQYLYLCYGVGVSEVEIDCLTGQHELMRTDIVMDVGNSINPAIDIGQIEGAFVQGYGMFILEDYHDSPDGHLLTCGPGTYKIPGFRDIPREFNVYLLDRAPNPKAICSSKAVGEPPLLLSASVIFAIKDAISSARSDVGLSGVFRLDSPACSERIRMACQDQFTQQFKEPDKGNYQPFFVRP